MPKQIQKWKILLTLLLLLIINACKTTQQNKSVELPPKPQRQEISIPANNKEYAAVLLYYESLVQEWEVWAETVKTLIERESYEY